MGLQNDIDDNNMLEHGLSTFLDNHDYNDTRHIATLTIYMNNYQREDNAASQREIHFRKQVTKRKYNDKHTGPTAIRAATATNPTKPLTALRRDIEGPNGEPIGSITCKPHEVDDIASRAWAAVY